MIFEPRNRTYKDNTYYFVITVKEVNSDSVKYDYYCTVSVYGDYFTEEDLNDSDSEGKDEEADSDDDDMID